MGDDLGLCAFERHLHLEASLDLAFLVFLLGYVAVVHNLGEVLLGGTCHPYLVLTCLGEFGDNLLKVEVAVTFLVDELAHFIGKKNQTVVIALVFEVGGQFHTEAVDAEYGVALDDALAYAIHRECRCQFLGNVEHPVQFVVYEVGSHTGVIPVAPFLGYTLLESFKHTLFLQGLFEVLSQGDIELIEATLAVELIPEYMQESLLLVGRVVVARFEIEDAGVDGGTFQPVGYREQLLIVEADVVLLIEWVDSLHCIEQTLHGGIAGVGRDAVVEVLQKV